MTRKEIDDIFQEYGQYATGKDYALVHAIAKTVAAQKCVCGEPNSSGTHRTDGPCLAPQPEQKPVAKVSKRYVNNIQWLNKLPEFDTLLYTTPPQRTWVGLTDEEITEWRKRYKFSRALLSEVEAKLKEKNP